MLPLVHVSLPLGKSNDPHLNELKGLFFEQLVHYIDDNMQQHELIQLHSYCIENEWNALMI